MFAEPFVAENVVEFVVDERIGVTSLKVPPSSIYYLRCVPTPRKFDPSRANQLCKRLAVP